ncbi:hypothetical protein ES703_112059 [subsurface metagenome]
MKADCGEMHPLDQGLAIQKPVFLMARQAGTERKMADKTYLKTTLAISILFVLLGVCGTAHAEIIYVDDDGPGDFTNIQAAIDAAVDGDVVIIAPDTYTGDGNRDIDFHGKAITVRSIDPNDPNIVAVTIIDCNGTRIDPHRGFYFHSNEDANSVLAGLTITNGYASYGGGAIYCGYSSNPTITRCNITANVSGSRTEGSGRGGGICCELSSPIISNCTFLRNHAYYRDWQYPNTGLGGAMYCSRSNLTIINCTFLENGAPGYGGQLHFQW